MINKYLDRLLELDRQRHEPAKDESDWVQYNEEYQSLKSKLEEQLEKTDYILQHLKDREKISDELEQQVKELQEEKEELRKIGSVFKKYAEMYLKETEDLKQKLEKIRELGRKIEYGNPEDNEFINVPDELKSILESKK